MPEGTVFFADEPILRVTAPLPEAQFVETRLINILHFQSLIAAKAARSVLAAPDKVLVDFGLRRAHGAEAGLMAARASYLAGFAGTATVLAGEQFGIPLYGTMAHSFIEAFDDETAAFEAFARARPDNLVLLLDTYDTEAAARKVVALRAAAQGSTASRSAACGSTAATSSRCRKACAAILDQGGLRDVTIFASGGLDEDSLAEFARPNAPIDGIGIGTSLTTSSDVPALDCVYKLQEYAGLPRRKRSAKKATWPGRKQVWRRYGADGRMAGDVLALEGHDKPGEPLLSAGDARTAGGCDRRTARRAFGAAPSASLNACPKPLRRLGPGATYPVEVATNWSTLAAEVDRRLQGRRRSAT